MPNWNPTWYRRNDIDVDQEQGSLSVAFDSVPYK